MAESIYQTPEWEEFKKKTGYEKSYRIDGVLVLQRKLALGRTMLYSPLVAEKNYESGIKNQGFLDKVIDIGKKNNAIFYRLELNIPIIHDSKFMIPKRFEKAFEEMQPENNWILDISKSEEKLLSEMKEKGRYNIRVAEKKSVIIEEDNSEKGLDIFYSQYATTGKRHKVTFRSKKYFQTLLEILGKKGYARVFIAYAEINGKKTPLASAIELFYGKEVQYLFGASSDEYKNLMAPYLLHWGVIKKAKKEGYESYNFLGIAPNDDPKHPWAGITRFKKQFGGYQNDIAGCYDLILKPVEYKLFKIAEKIRR